MAKSPRIVPGALASGFVAPRMARPVLTTSRPSQTMAHTGPEPMSANTGVSSAQDGAMPEAGISSSSGESATEGQQGGTR